MPPSFMPPVRPRIGSRSATLRCTKPGKASSGVCHEHERKLVMLYRRWETASRSRLTGAGFKPPGAAAFKRRGGERPWKSHPKGWQVRVEKMSESKPFDDASLIRKALSKLGSFRRSRISQGGTCLRP